MNKAQPEPGDWNSYLQRFKEGKSKSQMPDWVELSVKLFHHMCSCWHPTVVFGSWYEHVRGWWEKKQSSSRILYLFYEDMIEVSVSATLFGFRDTSMALQRLLFLQNTERELNRLCSFLGLSPTAEVKNQVMEKVQFDKMKNNRMANYSTDEYLDFKISPFIRKGEVYVLYICVHVCVCIHRDTNTHIYMYSCMFAYCIFDIFTTCFIGTRKWRTDPQTEFIWIHFARFLPNDAILWLTCGSATRQYVDVIGSVWCSHVSFTVYAQLQVIYCEQCLRDPSLFV